MAEKTRFDRALDDHLLARDLAIIGVLVLSFAGGMVAVLGMDPALALGGAVGFAIVWLAIMETLANRQGGSMFRYFGGDPLE